MTFKLNDTGASARVNDFFTRTTEKLKKHLTLLAHIVYCYFSITLLPCWQMPQLIRVQEKPN